MVGLISIGILTGISARSTRVNKRFISPEDKALRFEVQKPARYVGGVRCRSSDRTRRFRLRIAVSFRPLRDGMSTMRFDHLFDANEDETCLHVREFCASPDLSTLIQKNIPLYTLGWHSLLILMYLRLLLDMSSATKNTSCDYGARGVSLEIPSAAKVLNCNSGGRPL